MCPALEIEPNVIRNDPIEDLGSIFPGTLSVEDSNETGRAEHEIQIALPLREFNWLLASDKPKSLLNYKLAKSTKRNEEQSSKMSAIPARYDPRVVVIPCAPDRVPDLPVQILYLIAQELPQPKSVFNLAIASKGTWDYLQPALYQCEVTYEARLIHKYGGGTSEKAAQSNEPSCHEQCGECQGRINLDDRTFESPVPENLLCTDRRITALHWASMQGESALPVALKAIRSALKHQPSYIDGMGLRARQYREVASAKDYILVSAELPPPLSLAVAQGNF